MTYNAAGFLAGLFNVEAAAPVGNVPTVADPHDPPDRPAADPLLPSDLLALLSDGGGYEREERAAIVWCETAPAHEVDAALRAAIDGFEQLCRGDARQDLAEAAAPRPRSAVPVARPAVAADFVLLLTPDELPPVPFALNGWTMITDAAKFLRWLRADILRGPSGPRARLGTLQADLLELRRFVLAEFEKWHS